MVSNLGAQPLHSLTPDRYNANVRGNGDEDLNLQEFMHTIHDCRRQESESSTIKNLPSQAPSRLLYFDHDHKICRLVETNGRFFSYVALSYVWHSEQNMPRLTRDTYDHFKKGIPYSDIRLLNSASFFMEQADVQYLWVDSCCIVQDDSADVAAELSTMSGTYANSMATIVSSSPYRSEARLSANRWWSRGWILQEELLSGRQLVLGDFALRSHESDKFSQTWFSRVVAKFVNMSLDGCGIDSAYRSSGCPSISCQHQDCDTYYFLLKGDKESLFVDLPEDLVKALQQSFSWSFKSKAQQKPPHEQTYTPSNANIYTTEENKKDTKEELTVDTCAQEKTSSSESTDRAWQLLHEGYKLFEDRSTVQALAKFFLAREHVSSAVSESSDALKIHILTSVYIANFYLQEKSFDTAMEVVQTPKNRMLGCNIFEEPLLPM